jgi:hypothetical protein
MCAQAGSHGDDARRQLLEGIFETQSPDPHAEGNLPVGGESNEVKHLLSMSTPSTTGDDILDSIRDFMAASPAQHC